MSKRTQVAEILSRAISRARYKSNDESRYVDEIMEVFKQKPKRSPNGKKQKEGQG